jgi:hypothetical protein
MTRQQVLAAGIRESRVLFLRYAKGFDGTLAVRQTEQLPNHLLWTLGHLSLTQYRVAEKIDGTAPPDSVFVDGHFGDAVRFAVESVAFGSTPRPDAGVYPSFERSLEIFADSTERLAHAVERADDITLDRPVPWGTQMVPAYTLAFRMIFHNGTHCGQIADLRRVLGMKSIFG